MGMVPMDEIDIGRAAKLLVDHHGILAEDMARNRQLELLAIGEGNGFAVWGRIRDAVGELQQTTLRKGERSQ